MKVLILYLLFLLLNSSDTVNGAPLPEISKSPTTTQAVIRDALIEGCSGLSWSPIRGEMYYIPDPGAVSSIPGLPRQFAIIGRGGECKLEAHELIKLIQNDERDRNMGERARATPKPTEKSSEETRTCTPTDKSASSDSTTITALGTTLGAISAAAVAYITWLKGWYSKIKGIWDHLTGQQSGIQLGGGISRTESRLVNPTLGAGIRHRAASDSTPNRPRIVRHLHLHHLSQNPYPGSMILGGS